MPLNIIVAGAGLAGLTASIALTSKGHNVTLYERRDDDDRGVSGSGIQLQPNAIRVLRKFELMEAIDEVSQNSYWTDMRDYQTGKTLALVDMERRGGVRYAVRWQMKKGFVEEAVKRGVKLHKGNGVLAVHEEGSKPVVELEDHSMVMADLVIGADGTYSKVRQSLFPSYKPAVLDTVVFQVQVPEAFIQHDSDTRELDRNHPAVLIFPAPGRATVSSPCIQTHEYDLQAIDMEFPLENDPHPEVRLGWVHDMDHLRERFADHFPGIRKVLTVATRYYKWRLTEVSNLPSWSSTSGKIVFIGDAAHAMTPNAGQGSAMGVEDAAVIAELLADASPGDDLRERIKLYEKLRRPRCEVAQKYAAVIGRTWGSKDPKMVRKMLQTMRTRNDSRYAAIELDKDASFVSPAFEKWLDLYDASEEVRKALNEDGVVLARL